jgi:hypothetical protein
MPDREWIGKTVDLQLKGLGGIFSNKPISLDLTTETANALASSLLRLKQTTFALPNGVQELLQALDYVLVGDPASTASHKRMEAGKGMTPDGGYQAPDLLQHPYVEHPANPGFCHAASGLTSKTICWQPRAAHYAEGAQGEREVNP